MSEPQTEPTPAPQPTEQPSQSQPDAASGDTIATYNVSVVKRYTGATHYVQGGSSVDLVRHADTGEPEMEYALVADMDGTPITLATWNAGRIDTRVANEAQRQQSQQQV